VTGPRSVPRMGEVAVFGVLTLLGVGVAWASLDYGLTLENGQVGPGLMPAVSGVLLAALGVALLVRTRGAGPTEAATEEDDEVDIHGRTRPARIRQLWIVFALLLATIVAVNVLGFLVAFGGFVLVVSTWVERRRVLSSLALTATACAVIYAVFVVFLRVPLPPGVLGI
jgi:putative tricarboxylic transport membrane protein